jgi:MFS family permease
VIRNPYAEVLRVPGAAAFSAAGGLARLPNAMVAIGTVLMMQEFTGSYAVAGRVSAVLVVAQAVGAPQAARLVDRIGQRKVLFPLLAVTTAGLFGLVGAAAAHAPEPVLWVLAVVAGAAQGSYGSYVRARWMHVLRDPHHVHTAFSFEAAVDELVFIVGPIIATALATTVVASGGLLVAAVAGAVGGTAFLVQRRTEPPVRSAAPPVRSTVGVADDAGVADIGVVRLTDEGAVRTAPPAVARRTRSTLLSPGMPALAAVFLAMGIIFGAVDVSTVAFATEQGARQLAGVLLAAFAGGSMVSGLAYGAVHWTSRLSTRFLVGTVVLAAGVSLFLTAQSKWALAIAMGATGLWLAPTLVNGNAMVQSLVPQERFTEGLAWVGTAIGAGAAIGSWLAGTRIDAGGSEAGFVVAMGAGWLCVVLALVALPTLRRR